MAERNSHPQALAEDRCDIQVIVAPAADAVELLQLDPAPAQPPSLEHCLDVVRDAGVLITDDLKAAVRAMLQAGNRRAAIARSTPPPDGHDAFIDWHIHSLRPEATDDTAAVNHYEKSSLILVSAGQILGRLIPPTPGQDGHDVRGKPLPAKPGKPLKAQIDAKSIDLDTHHQLTALTAGVLHRDDRHIRVNPLVELPGNVDFSTGNIRFHGDVRVRGDVLDRFVIEAGGDVEVLGVIEAATITTGGNLTARGGVTALPDGKLNIAGELIARYLANVTADIKGNLTVEREILNSHINAHSCVELPRGSLIGGTLFAHGNVHIATLGAPSGAATRLRLPAKHTPELLITRQANPGSTITIGRRHFEFLEEVRGPLHIHCQPDGCIMATTRGGTPHPLATLPAIRHYTA